MRRALLAVALLSLVLPLSGSSASAQAQQLPNLVPLPPMEVAIGAPDGEFGGPPAGALRFATAVANRGEFHFDLFGRSTDPLGQKATAQQCVGWAAPRVCSQRADVGNFVWHPEHGHHHFEDFALYELRNLRKNGRPNFKPAGLIAGGNKVSFCLMDIEPDDHGTPSSPSILGFGYPLYMSCSAGTGFQGISAGWRDVYSNGTTGQQILLAGVPDGIYALVVTTDPEELILETSKTDNVAVTGVALTDGGSQVEVVCASEPGTTRCLPLDPAGG